MEHLLRAKDYHIKLLEEKLKSRMESKQTISSELAKLHEERSAIIDTTDPSDEAKFYRG